VDLTAGHFLHREESRLRKKIEFLAKFKELVNNPSIDAVIKLQKETSDDGIAALESVVTGGPENIVPAARMLEFTEIANKTLADWSRINFSTEEYKEIYTRVQKAVNYKTNMS